jgi:aminoglycoside phosphotransferase (APT) family kinase protein
MLDSLIAQGLVRDLARAKFAPLTGGVSSDIWRIEADGRVFCVKRALAKLKVKADWFAPIERNRHEVAWYQIANEIVPGAAPRVLAHDEIAMLCAMEFLDPAEHKLWKSELRDGRADVTQAAKAGEMLGKIHSGSAGRADLKQRFPLVDIFHAIRLEPYLEATATKHPDLKQQLFALSQRTAANKLVMIHGDVSPKNILLGPRGPVFLDAECACIGDPAFDIAFCLNHFLLKCLWNPPHRDAFIACFLAMATSYLAQVDWEPVDQIEARAASLLPGLFLARVDGKSPAEYVTAEQDKEHIRHCARALLFNPPTRLAAVADAWIKELAA